MGYQEQATLKLHPATAARLRKVKDEMTAGRGGRQVTYAELDDQLIDAWEQREQLLKDVRQA